MHDALETLKRIGAPRALVVGDVMLDRYVSTEAERITAEAPLSVSRSRFDEQWPGGAASVAYMLRALEVRVTLFSLVGDDDAGRTLRRLLDDLNVEPSLFVDDRRVTFRRERIAGRTARQAQQLASVSHRAIGRRLEDSLFRALTDRLPQFDVLVISDYRTGLCTRRLLGGVIESAADLGIPILVAPAHGADYARYRRASLLTTNRIQAQVASGVTIRSPRDALTAGRLLCQQSHVESVLITLDAEGMALVPADGQGMLMSSRPLQVRGVAPPADLILAVLGFCGAARIDWPAAAKLAGVIAADVERSLGSVRKRDKVFNELLRAGVGNSVFREEVMAQNGKRN